MKRRRKWSIIEGAAGLLGAALAGRAVEAAWRRASGRNPPKTPGTKGVKWRQAIVFTALSSVAIGISQLLASGAASAAWRRVKGTKPPR